MLDADSLMLPQIMNYFQEFLELQVFAKCSFFFFFKQVMIATDALNENVSDTLLHIYFSCCSSNESPSIQPGASDRGCQAQEVQIHVSGKPLLCECCFQELSSHGMQQLS